MGLLVPSRNELHGTNNIRTMTVGKIYTGMLILENYRSYKLQKGFYQKIKRKTSFINQIMDVVRNNAKKADQKKRNKSSDSCENFIANTFDSIVSI
jgi:hypothetical protein